MMVNDNSNVRNYPDSNTLKELRQRLGWTQPQMAQELGITDRTIQRIERGEYILSVKVTHLKRFLSLLREAGMSVDDLPDD